MTSFGHEQTTHLEAMASFAVSPKNDDSTERR